MALPKHRQMGKKQTDGARADPADWRLRPTVSEWQRSEIVSLCVVAQTNGQKTDRWAKDRQMAQGPIRLTGGCGQQLASGSAVK